MLLIVCVIAGAAAGIGTGFAGLSATTVIAPMLISFLGYPWYESVGIGLAADVLASAFSAWVYRKNKNIDLKNGMIMVVAVLMMTVVGSYFSQYMPDREMGWFTVLASLGMGIRFLVKPATQNRFAKGKHSPMIQKIKAFLAGGVIGFYCGFMGVGGGMMMLFVLTCILGYELKVAVGTSVFVMTFTAFTGSASHVYFGDIRPYLPALFLCILFTLLAAWITSYFANHMDAIKTNRATGLTLVILGIGMFVRKLAGVLGWLV